MLAPGGEIDQPGPVADFALASLRAWPEFVRELEQESGVVIDYRASGALEVALHDAEAATLDAKAAWFQRHRQIIAAAEYDSSGH